MGVASNYTLTGGTHSVTINQKALGSSGTRVYDGTNTASSSDLTLSGLVGSETLTLSGSGTVPNASVEAGKSVSLGSIAIANGTGLASNYSLSGSFTMDITARPVTASGSRVYDGSTTVSGADINAFTNLVGSETLSASGSGSVASANVGSGKSVTLGTLALANGSGSASNYSLSSASFEISQRPLTLVGSKVYDGTTSIQGSDITTFTNIVGSETLLVTGSGSVSSANVGSGKSVTTGSLSLANNTGLASNYSINSTSANITARPINLSGSRTYDSTRTANGSDLNLANVVTGETLSMTGSGVLGSPAAGTQTIVNTNTLALADGSGSASNYSLVGGTLTMTILPRSTSVTGSRSYDGTVTITPSDLTTFSNLAGSDSLSFTGSGTVTSSGVGSSKTVTLGSLALDNSSGVGSNYTLSSVTVNITKRILNLDGIRAYDASTTASSSDITIGNLVSGENLTLSGSGTVPNNSVEMNKTITLGSLAIANGSGGTASNYTLSGGLILLTYHNFQ